MSEEIKSLGDVWRKWWPRFWKYFLAQLGLIIGLVIYHLHRLDKLLNQ